jgi:hypothetical protein
MTAVTIWLPSKREPFVLIPHDMRPGQSPQDILPELRGDWQRIPADHPLIARDVDWHPGTFDVVELPEFIEHRGVVITAKADPATHGFLALAGGRSRITWGRSEVSALEAAKLLVEAAFNDPYSINGPLWLNDSIHWRAALKAAQGGR